MGVLIYTCNNYIQLPRRTIYIIDLQVARTFNFYGNNVKLCNFMYYFLQNMYFVRRVNNRCFQKITRQKTRKKNQQKNCFFIADCTKNKKTG